MPPLSRRDILKLAGAAAPLLLAPALVRAAKRMDASRPNVVIILFDAMSARNLSVYGYPRPTAINFERFAERANVYHSHYASGNFTIPGTSSLLTGIYPWTHRAFSHAGMIAQEMTGNNIFRALGPSYHRLAFPQNTWSDFVVTQFQSDIDSLLSAGMFSQLSFLLGDKFNRDRKLATRALDDFLFNMDGEPASLIFGPLREALYTRKQSRLPSDGYPRGMPYNGNYPINFTLEDLFSGLASLITGLPSPFFAYLHLFPPHAPYRATTRFDSQFIGDGFTPIRKPVHRFAQGDTYSQLNSARRSYDEYIASIDFELGRLMDTLEESGIFENSYVILTSDHGEMFERGEKAHITPLLYDPVVHAPLLISSPGQTSRRDIYAPTNAVDLLPTILTWAGSSIPSWAQGQVLPGFGGEEDAERSTFTLDAKENSQFAPIRKATFAMRKGPYKLLYYTGYEKDDTFELYDLESDIEEMTNLYPSNPSFAKQMKEELLDMISSVNAPYKKK